MNQNCFRMKQKSFPINKYCSFISVWIIQSALRMAAEKADRSLIYNCLKEWKNSN